MASPIGRAAGKEESPFLAEVVEYHFLWEMHRWSPAVGVSHVHWVTGVCTSISRPTLIPTRPYSFLTLSVQERGLGHSGMNGWPHIHTQPSSQSEGRKTHGLHLPAGPVVPGPQWFSLQLSSARAQSTSTPPFLSSRRTGSGKVPEAGVGVGVPGLSTQRKICSPQQSGDKGQALPGGRGTPGGETYEIYDENTH